MSTTIPTPTWISNLPWPALLERDGQIVAATPAVAAILGGCVGRPILEVLPGSRGVSWSGTGWRAERVGVDADGLWCLTEDRAPGETSDALHRFAEADFSHRHSGPLADVLDAVAANNSARLRAAVDESDRMRGDIEHIRDTSGSLSDEATRAAASLEEISASVEVLSAQTAQNAQNAHGAVDLANAAAAAARDGDALMIDMLRAMAEIESSSQNISRIIKVIDEIAFQTNLLALNAAVEAARAGAHGKGFAVVAEEVRNLAARSARAAKETTEMIQGSLGKVRLGSEIATRTAQALTRIVDGVGRASVLVSDIAASSNEQARGIQQINAGISQVDHTVQQNTASAQQLAAAASGLAGSSVQLAEALGAFSLRPQAAAPAGVSPEMFQAFMAFMAGQGGRHAHATPHAHEHAARPAANRPATPSHDLAGASDPITAAIAAHSAWKRKLTAAIDTGNYDGDIPTVRRDDACDFGRWLHGPSISGVDRSTPEYRSVVQLHAAFHRAAADTLDDVARGRADEARESLELGGAFASASAELTAAMTAWKHKR
jgi:hypothetical protein